MTIQRRLVAVLFTALQLLTLKAFAFAPATIRTTTSRQQHSHHPFSSSTSSTSNAAPPLRMSSTDSTTTEVPIILNGQNIELTPALVEHVNKRIGAQLNKLASNGAIRECDVVLSVNKNPKVR